MEPRSSSNNRRSSVSNDDRARHQGRSRASPGQLSPSTSMEPQQQQQQRRQSSSLAPLDPLDEQQQASPPPETLDQLYEGLGAEADASTFAGHELYRALRGDKGDDPLADELLWEGDFMFTQRDYIQRKQEDELLERLERRMGTTKAKPMQQQVRVPSAGGAPPGSDPNTPTSPPSAAIAGLAAAAATGVMNLLGRVMPEGSRGASVDDPSRRVSALSPAMSSAASLARYGSGFSSAPGQLTPPSRLSQLGDGPTPSAQDSPAAAAAAAETVTPRPFLERVTSSFRRCSSVNDRTAAGSAVGALGVLVAEDEAKRKAAEALPAVETPASGQLSVSAGAGEAQPADAIVQVVKVVPKQPTAKELEEKERAAQEELQRMDTDARLQLEIDTYPWLRRKAVQICTHSDFELIVLLLIMGNCISLALYDPLQAEDSHHNQTLQHVDLGLNVAFTVEMLLRIISMGGVLHYLSHPWNAFDCLMVLAGYTTFIPMDANSAGLEGVKALRALRALRPLRTITRFAALRSIVVCFLEAVPLLVSVAAMLFFFLFIFAVAAAEIFGDSFHYACVDPGSGRMEKDTVLVEDEFGCGDRSCPAEFSECQLFSYSLATQIAGFENVGMSMLSVFQAMTLTNWSFSMYRTMDYLSPAVVIYWLVMVVFGAYFVLNLFLAVLKTKFAKAKNLLDEKRRQRRAMKNRRGSKKRNVLARATGWMKTRVASHVSSKAGNDTLTSHVAEVMAKKTASEFGGVGDFDTPRSNITGFTDFLAAQTGDGGTGSGHQPADGSQSVGVWFGNATVKPPVTRQLSRADSSGSGMSGYSGYSGTSGYSGFTGMTGASAASAAECLLSFEEFDESVQDLPWFKRTMLRAQYRVRWAVTSSWFNNIFLLLIILNTVALAIVYEGMSHEVEEVLAMANFVFTAAFTLEMLLKMIGLGAWNYLRDAWNLFDALVVAFSLVELVTELMARTSSGGLSALRSVRSLRVLRSFRVLRVMKMFKYLESLKMIAAVLISSMASFASIVVLLVLFWMVFSIVGLHVFGGLKLDIPWPNMDSLINSMINSFHILNLENFQITMFSVIRATNYASSMFWLAWIIMGKFILLTLFLAVTLDAFERKYESDIKKGVRSQSVASTMFSRLKKAGQRVKSMAASMAGSNNSGGKSGGGGSFVGTFSWRPGAGRSKGGGTSRNDSGAASGLSSFQAGAQSGGSGAGGDASMGLLPGPAPVDSTDGVAVVSAGPRTHSHGHRRSSVNGHSNDSSRRTTGQAPEGAQHRHHHHHHRRHSQEGRVQDHSRRSSIDSRGPSPQPPEPGPVAEGAAVALQDYYTSPGFGAGSMRLRQLRAGMQQQYSCAQQDLGLPIGFGWGSASANSASLAAAADAYTHRRSSSSSSGGGSSTGSFTIKHEAAAAFAAAAAAEALRPCHVLPELLEDAAEFTASSSRGGVFGPGAASSISSSSSGGYGSGDVDEADSFTWQEFLATVAAINYPSVHRQQQQALSRQHSSLQGDGSRGAGGLSGKASASLGPIAEGLEGADAIAIDQHPAPTGAPKSPRRAAPAQQERTSFDHSRISLSSPGRQDGQQLTARQLTTEAPAAASGAAHSHPQQQQPRLASAARSRSPVLQQLALADIDKDLASLGFQPTGAEPGTPTVGFSSSQGGSKSAKAPAGSSAAVADDMWAALEGDTQEYARRHGAADSPAAASSAGVVSSPAAAAAAAALSEQPVPVPPEGKPAKDPARRVTLFTESMRERGECPAPPRSPRFADRHTDSRGQRRPAGVLLSGSKLDEILDSAAAAAASSPTTGGTAGDGSRGGSRPASAAGSSHSNATLQLLAGGSVEPAITAQAIKRRKAAAVSFTADQLLASVSSAPQGLAESAAGLPASTQQVGTDSVTAIGSEAQSQASSSRRHSRATSGDGSEAGFSDGGHSYVSGDGSRSGGWSTFSGMGRSRSRSYPDLAGVSLGLFPQGNRFRQAVYDLVTNKFFDYGMFFLIMLNCIAMAYEYPTMSRDDLDGQILFWSDMVFTIAFTIEAALKIIAFGFKPYMSYFQNVIDILIVVSSLVMLVLDTMADLSVVKGLRVLRAIKPLRALTRSAGMQQIFKSLTLSLAAMGNVSMVVLLFFLIFGILGVQLFHGKFCSCNDTSVPDQAACVGTFVDGGVEVPRVWSNKPYNFDHLGMALVSLFVTVTLNGYLEIMDAAMAAPEDPGLQPQPMSNWSAFFFFAAFVLVVGYTLLNLYIGVVFYQFSRIRMQSQTGSAFLTDDQTEWVEMSKLVFRLKPPEKSPVPVNALRRRLYYFVQGKPFEYFIMAVIIGNSALMATSFYGQPAEMSAVVEAINYAFTGIYVLEFVLKVIGLGWPNYWKVMWNKFDCCLLVTGVVDMALTLAIGPSVASFLKIQKIMRLLRLARVVKLMRSMKGLRSLFGTLMLSLPAFWNVGGLLALMFFIYAYIGMLLLGHVKRNGALNEHTNFERFWTAALTLFKVATNDNWTDVMIGCMIGPPDCDPSKDCGSWVVYPYFLSFVVLVTIIMLQLFTAVIIESFEAQEEQDRWKMRPDHLDEFVELWAEYDDGSGTIDPKDLEAMLLRLSPPLGLGKGASSTDVLRFVFDLDIPLLNGRVPFQRTAYELVRRCSGAEIPEGILKDQIDKLVSRAFRNLKADEVLNFSVAVTVMRVQRKWRARMRAAKMKRKKEFRADRGVAPLYSDIVAARDSTMKEALRRRQAGDLRWRPHPAYSQLWCAAEAVLAAEAAAAVAASYPRRSSDSSVGADGEAGPGGRWSSLAGLRASADGWMHRVTGGLTGGLQRIQRDARGLFRRDTDRSGRSSIWGNFGSRATSNAASMAGGTSAAASHATSGGISNATSMVVSECYVNRLLSSEQLTVIDCVCKGSE